MSQPPEEIPVGQGKIYVNQNICNYLHVMIVNNGNCSPRPTLHVSESF